MARKHKNSLSTVAGRQQRIHGLAEAARQIAREQIERALADISSCLNDIF